MKPQLRFKEFTDDWEEKKLGEVAEIGTGKSKSNNCKLGNYPILGSTGIIGYDDDYDYHGNFILIARVGANAGYVYHKNGNFKITDNTLYLKFSNSTILTHVYYILINYKLNRLAFGTGQPLIKSSDLKNIKIQLPSLSEQEQIGKFFSLIDQRIEKHERKIVLLEEEKKGYMQKLFKQELRFKDEQGNYYPAWEEKKLGFILKVNSGKDYKKLNAGNIKVYGTGGVISTVDNYLSDEDGIGIGRKGTIDKPMYLKAPFWTVDTLFYCLTNQNKYFIYYLFQTISWKKYDESTGVPSLSKKNIENIKIQLPSLSEQEKIAKFLTLLDQRIEKEQEKLKLMKEEKQGLAQKLFI